MTIEIKKRIDNLLSEYNFFTEYDNKEKTYSLLKNIAFGIKEELSDAYTSNNADSVLMIDTKLTSIIRKNESILVLDIGGTNARKCIVNFNNEGLPIISKVIKTPISPMMKNGDFFRDFGIFISDGRGFSKDELINVEYISLCFSYPFRVENNGDACICGFAKGINMAEFEHKLLIKTIVDTLKEKGINLPYKGCVINDATASLFYLSLLDVDKESIKIGTIVGTGCNAGIYLKDRDDKTRAICTESGHLMLGKSNADLLSKYDKRLDKMLGTNNGSNFEMITSGFYLHKLFRVIAEEILTSDILNDGEDIDELNVALKNINDTKDFDVYLDDNKHCITSYVIKLIVKRASVFLSGLLLGLASLSGASFKNSNKKVDVFIEGSTYHLTKYYKNYTEEFIRNYSKYVDGYNFEFYYPVENDGKTILLGGSTASSIS